MKNAGTIAMLAAALFLLSSHAAPAQPWGRRNHPPPFAGGQQLITKEVHDRLFTEAIFELTGKEIDYESFRSTMDQKIIAEIQAAADNGSISEERAERIIERIQNRPYGPQ